MSIEVTDSVDSIGIETTTGKVILTISDHLDWQSEDGHMKLLQEKLNTYLAFIEGGELCRVYPQATGRAVVVRVMAKFSPCEAARRFFKAAGEIVRAAGFELQFEVFRGSDSTTGRGN